MNVYMVCTCRRRIIELWRDITKWDWVSNDLYDAIMLSRESLDTLLFPIIEVLGSKPLGK